MPSHSPPTLDPIAAQRWHRQMRRAANAPWMHIEVAARTLQRLDYLLLAPGSKLLWEPAHAGEVAQAEFTKRFDGAQCVFVQPDNTYFDDFSQSVQVFIELDAIKKIPNIAWYEPEGTAFSWLTRPFKGRLSGRKSVAPNQRPTVAPKNLPPENAQLVWSNLLIHGHPKPQALMQQWFDTLAVGGCAMFSALGVDTGRELRRAFDKAGYGPTAAQLTDMHDWGDMLIEAGFANPVMDMEMLTLTYPNARDLLADWRSFGRNAHVGRFCGLRTRNWRLQLEQLLDTALRQPSGQLAITVEVIYGHAFKPPPRHAVSEKSAISMQDMRAMLRRN